METFPPLLALCAVLPTQRPMTRSFDVSFDLRRQTNIWANNGDAGDLRCHRAQYDVIVVNCFNVNEAILDFTLTQWAVNHN